MDPILLWSASGRSYVCRCFDPRARKRKGLCSPCYERAYRKKKKACPVKSRDYKLRTRYGINTDQYGEMLVSQEGRCAICSSVACDELVLHVDHDHATGQIRQLLCGPCNTLLGMCRDSTDILQQAIAYLQRHQATHG